MLIECQSYTHSCCFVISLVNYQITILVPGWFTLFPFVPQTISVGRRKFSASFQLVFRLIKGLIFLTFVSILVTLIALPHMTAQDIVVCILAFMPTGWGLLLVSEYHFHLYFHELKERIQNL